MTKKNRMILQAEGAAVLVVSLYFYNQTDYSWWWFPLFLLFDLSMIGYLANNKVGALTYNLGHSYVLPLILLIISVESENMWLLVVTILWFTHIGFDRVQGYGLKEQKGFTHTHLGPIGFSKKKK